MRSLHLQTRMIWIQHHTYTHTRRRKRASKKHAKKQTNKKRNYLTKKIRTKTKWTRIKTFGLLISSIDARCDMIHLTCRRIGYRTTVWRHCYDGVYHTPTSLGLFPSPIARQPRGCRCRTICLFGKLSPRDVSNADILGTSTLFQLLSRYDISSMANRPRGV